MRHVFLENVSTYPENDDGNHYNSCSLFSEQDMSNTQKFLVPS